MSRLNALATLAASGRKLLIPYICCGDPSAALTVPLMHGIAAAGADVIELGIPFSDPMADGPVIQKASQRALAAGMTVKGVFRTVEEFRRKDPTTPVVLMGYANPVEAMGQDAFVAGAAAAGVDGLIIVDYPPDEEEGFYEKVKAAGMDPIFLVAPTTSKERLAMITQRASGFVYYVSLKGTTGSNKLDTADVSAHVAVLKEFTKLPVCVGFGVSTADQARAVAECSDGVVIGSALIKEIQSHLDDSVTHASQWLGRIRRAITLTKAE